MGIIPDPLSLLRQYITSKKEIVERRNLIYFGEFSWSKDVKTNYLMWRPSRDPRKGIKEYYTLESLLHFLKNIHLGHAVYVRQAAVENIPAVRRPDRKKLLAYLIGETSTCASIDNSALLEFPTRVKRTHDNENIKSVTKKPRTEDAQVQKVRFQLATRFEVPEGAMVGNIKSEENQARLNKNSTTIKINEYTDNNNSLDFKAILDHDMNYLISQERQCRTRTTVLQSNEKIFSGSNISLLQAKQVSFQAYEVVKPVRRPQRYSRYDQEKFNTKKEMEGFKIDTMGTYQGMILKSVVEGQNTCACTSKDSCQLSPIPRMLVRSESARTPIIIIPAAPTSLISLYNVKDVLQDHKYVSVQQKRAEGAVCESEVLLQRRKGGEHISANNSVTTMPYRVIDDPSRLSAAEWDRVVAAFVLGPAWQFKAWPREGNPADIFANICAFHLKFEDMKVDVRISRWAVNVLTLSRTRRHLDHAVLGHFWEKLDKHMMKIQPHLRF
ncbi:parafibromin-like [Cydia pomonella]|uniref:parafibromin-like n=1 Tax=Cydia pomonella TaxID=82600 RepID=UPI002ADD7B31|nr:parafibromin-like [Cydia pomonella]XP_061718419.1 parafibromin-like [Cydia pomonella]